MAATSPGGELETSIETKQVFMRANVDDPVEITAIQNSFTEGTIPESLTVIHRQETYFGPKFTVEGPDNQWLLTSPGPNSEALLWERQDMDWVQAAEVVVEIGEDLPQQKMCLHCGEPITTAEHRQASFLGTCDR